VTGKCLRTSTRSTTRPNYEARSCTRGAEGRPDDRSDLSPMGPIVSCMQWLVLAALTEGIGIGVGALTIVLLLYRIALAHIELEEEAETEA